MNGSSDDGACGSFRSEVRVEDQHGQQRAAFVHGEPIQFSVRITNHGNARATLSYDGCAAIRFVVLDSGDREVFDTVPEGTVCTLLLRPIDYAPQQTEEFELTWNQARGDGSQVPTGRYSVSARDRSVECAGRLEPTRDFAIE